MPDTKRTSRAEATAIQRHITDIEEWFPVTLACAQNLATDYLAALDVIQVYANLWDDEPGNPGTRARAFLASTEGEQP